MDYKIKPERTAITTGVSTSCKKLVEDYHGGYVLDYGFGKLRNSKYIIENGISVDILDTDIQISENQEKIESLNIKNVYDSNYSLPENYYSQILLSFVLNVIPNIEDRVFILNNIKKGLKSDGKLYIEVRDSNFIKQVKHKEIYNDGYAVGAISKKTFQKPYTLSEIRQFVEENGFYILDTKKTSGSIMLICSKDMNDSI